MHSYSLTSTVRLSLPLFVLLIVILFSSCGNNKDVLIYNRELDAKTITVDDEVIEIDTNSSFTYLRLEPGPHTIESNGVLPSSIEVTDDCLISSGETEFVIFPVLYGDENANSSAWGNLGIPKSPIIIGDSIILYYGAENQTELLKSMAMHKKIHDKCKNCDKLSSNFKVLTSNNNIYPKEWEYTLEKLPETVRATSGNSTTKTTLHDLTTFRIYALIEDAYKYETIENDSTLQAIKDFNKSVYGIE